MGCYYINRRYLDGELSVVSSNLECLDHNIYRYEMKLECDKKLGLFGRIIAKDDVEVRKYNCMLEFKKEEDADIGVCINYVENAWKKMYSYMARQESKKSHQVFRKPMDLFKEFLAQVRIEMLDAYLEEEDLEAEYLPEV